jgi:hypothetical protein
VIAEKIRLSMVKVSLWFSFARFSGFTPECAGLRETGSTFFREEDAAVGDGLTCGELLVRTYMDQAAPSVEPAAWSCMSPAAGPLAMTASRIGVNCRTCVPSSVPLSNRPKTTATGARAPSLKGECRYTSHMETDV